MNDSSLRLMLAAAALAAALELAACSAPGPRAPEQAMADKVLAGRVTSALRRDAYVDADHVTVEADNGVVTLSGQVGDEWDLRSILQICWDVPGVQRVNDQLEMIEFGRGRR